MRKKTDRLMLGIIVALIVAAIFACLHARGQNRITINLTTKTLQIELEELESLFMNGTKYWYRTIKGDSAIENIIVKCKDTTMITFISIKTNIYRLGERVLKMVPNIILVETTTGYLSGLVYSSISEWDVRTFFSKTLFLYGKCSKKVNYALTN